MEQASIVTDSSFNRRRSILVGWFCIVAIVAWIVNRVWNGLFIPWWFNTDEVVFFYEVIRQLRLDLTQTFFDIPGTPYMTLTSLVTTGWWFIERFLGLTNSGSASDFAFEHIQGVYTLMRSLTLSGYVIAVGLSYEVFRRVGNLFTGVFSAILIATLPIHVQYSHFVRTESLGLVLCLSAILCLIHPRTALLWETYLISGILTGIAMGARFHFAFSGLPVLLSVFFLHDRPQLKLDETARPYRLALNAAVVLAAILSVGGLITLLLKLGVIAPGLLTHTMLLTTTPGEGQYSGAKQAIAKLWMLLGSGSIVLAVLVQIKAMRARLLSVVNAFTLCLITGFTIGFLVSHPTFLWRGEFQLRSIQFYSDWLDPRLAMLSQIGSWWKVTSYYFTTALPERWLQWSFLFGAIAIIWIRKPLAVSCLIGATMCFVAHPITMKLWPHHIIPWLPFLCFVAAYPIGCVADVIARRLRRPKLAPTALVLISASVLVATLSKRLSKADEYLNISRARTVQIREMNQWLSGHISADTFLAVSYYSLNDEGFYKWIESAGVSVPQHVKRFHDVVIWWLQRGTLDGKIGYVCVSRADIAFFRDDSERKNPGSTYNPFDDIRFQEVAKFGGGFYELKVFKFDFRHPSTH